MEYKPTGKIERTILLAGKGLTYDTGGAEMGRVKAVLNHGADDLLEIQRPGGSQTLLLPFTRAAVPTVGCRAAGRGSQRSR